MLYVLQTLRSLNGSNHFYINIFCCCWAVVPSCVCVVLDKDKDTKKKRAIVFMLVCVEFRLL